MAISEVLKAAEADADAASDAVRAVIGANYLPFTEAELLSFAETFETHSRLVFTAQVRIAGEIDTRKMAATHGASSTAAQLREEVQGTLVEHGILTQPKPFASAGELDAVPGRSRKRLTRTANSTTPPTRTRSNCTSAPATPAPA